MENRPSVLVVEDDLSWRMIYQEILEEEGYFVEVATSQAEVERKLRERVFDVAIIDLRLVDQDPKNLDGVRVVKLLHDQRTRTRAIVQSGYLTAAVRSQLDECGVFAVLDKEGTVQQLTDVVASAVRASECRT